MDDFLDADCVFESLFDKKILIKKEWKLGRGTASNYDVIFELTGSARIAGFAVYIKGTYHCIGVTSLLNNAKRFCVPVDDILLRCSMKRTKST